MADNWDRAIRIKAKDAGITLRGGRAVSNAAAGIGGSGDLILNASINSGRTTQSDRVLLETLYAKFWAAAKIVDLKPDDAFASGIVWNDDSEENVEKMKDEMTRLGVMKKALGAVKAARLYGTAVIIVAPKSGNFLEPLMDEEVMEGDISHLLVVDRFNLEDHITEGNPANPMFGKIVVYRWNFQTPAGQMMNDTMVLGSQVDVHHSRIIRFDGVPPPTDDGWDTTGDDRWGQSVLVRAIEDIIQDKLLNAGIVELVKRACVPIIKLPDLKRMLGTGKTERKGQLRPEQYAAQISEQMTAFNLIFLDSEDEVGKLELHTTGMADIVEKQANRMAMIEGIPITRFTGQSATGLSATGEGDAKDWRITVEAYRRTHIDMQFKRLLDLTAKSAGLMDTPEWEWGRLGEATPEETATIAKMYAETVVALLTANSIDESEARVMLNNSELFDLDEEWEPPPLEVQMMPEPAVKTKGDPKKPSRPTNMRSGATTSPPRR